MIRIASCDMRPVPSVEQGCQALRSGWVTPCCPGPVRPVAIAQSIVADAAA